MGARSEETTAVHRSGEPVETKLRRIAAKARKEMSFKFTSLYHLLNEELLRGCFKGLRKDAAAGIDKMTKDIYAENLDTNLSDLIERLKQMAYIPQPVRRKYIPKPGSTKQRPLGIPCFEDKLVQAGLVQVMESIYEQDFVGDSYGFRPSRSCHDALKALSETVENRPINHIVEADIKGFFDNVNQEWLMKFLEHRIGDKRIQRMVKRFLKAGVEEDGSVTVSDEGTPQGGVISPLLANVYLHYALDLWFERVYRKSCTGFARLIRYADDCVPRRHALVWNIQCMPCCTKDEGRPLETAIQVEVSNHRKLRRLKAGVVSVTEKARQDSVRYVSRRRTQVNHY